MKTIKEWLETLPEPYRTQALKNTPFRYLKYECESRAKALISAFFWGDSPQKHDYWYRLHKSLSLPDPIDAELYSIANVLVTIGDKANEYLHGNVSNEDFRAWLETIGETYALKV